MGENQGMASSGRPPLMPRSVAEARAAGGLRERKKQRTRDTIQREAMRLFVERGYEETTIEQIAEAADISPSTFFNYFPSKEDVVIADRYDPMIVEMFLSRPAGEPLSATIRNVLAGGLGVILEREREMILARSRLILAVPALRARIWEDLERTEDLFCSVLAERSGRDPYDFELRVVVMVLVGAMWAAAQHWVRTDGREPLLDLVLRAMEVVEAGARLDAIERPADGPTTA
jgi:AcrR family transcriptional regulator